MCKRGGGKMPWRKVEDVPKQVKPHKGITLTLAQANFVANIADGAGSWGIAWTQFEKAHKVSGKRWVKRKTT